MSDPPQHDYDAAAPREHGPERCDWCGDPIGDADCIRAMRWRYNSAGGGHLPHSEVVASFHDDRPCFEQARENGWPAGEEDE